MKITYYSTLMRILLISIIFNVITNYNLFLMVDESRSLKICIYEEAKVALKLLFNFFS